MNRYKGEPAPTFDEGARRWVYKYAKRNYWRVASWYDLDDLLQDGALCFFKCLSTYHEQRRRHVVWEQPHLMALTKVTFANHITDMATERTRLPEIPFADFVDRRVPNFDEDVFWERIRPSDPPEQLIAVLLKEAPYDVLQVLRVLMTDAGQLLQREYPHRKPDGMRETLNDTLCRILGYDASSVNLVNRAIIFIEIGV